ncbi:hypothetical protein Hanom_Chr01g00006291 [Helianthus anomalus]
MMMSHVETNDQRWPNSQSHQLSRFPVQESSEYTVSNPALSSSRFLVDVNQNRENDDPNSMKITEKVECKVTQKSVKGRCLLFNSLRCAEPLSLSPRLWR